MRYVIDIEGNSLISDSLDYTQTPYKLKATCKIWCIVIKNIDNNVYKIAKQEQCTREWLQTALEDCTEIIGHNIVKFDLPMLKLHGLLDYTVGELGEFSTIFNKPVVITDTLIYSRLFNPDRFGGHSLDSWGKRVKAFKLDFRGMCIEKGYITHSSPRGAEFQSFCNEMVTYCTQDVDTNHKVYDVLMVEKYYNTEIEQAYTQELKLADRALNRETLGFWFDKPLALNCVEDLNNKMTAIENFVVPLLPPKPRNIGELKEFTPPKKQINKLGHPTAGMIAFAKKIGATLLDNVLYYKENSYVLPYEEPLETFIKADIKNSDHIKMFLMSLGWEPTEWKERDLTKDAKKQNLPYDKRIKALDKWYKETMEGKYKKDRLKVMKVPEYLIYDSLVEALKGTKPVKVLTSPMLRVGLEKELCPNLVALGDKVAFAKDYSEYLTYKHRRNCIIGGYDDDADYSEVAPDKGYLASYREEDSRIPTPAIEIGAATFRYKHIGVSNVPRITSLYGHQMRSLFGCGPNAYQYGADFASLENRILGHYVYNYTDGVKLAEQMMADKPNDFHCYSEDTEILTEFGWKRFNEINLETLVAQYSRDKRRIEWVYPTHITWKKYKGKMISLKSKDTEQLITPSHRMYFEGKTKIGSKVVLAKNIQKTQVEILKEHTWVFASGSTTGKKEHTAILKLAMLSFLNRESVIMEDLLELNTRDKRELQAIAQAFGSLRLPFKVITENRSNTINYKVICSDPTTIQSILKWVSKTKILAKEWSLLNNHAKRVVVDLILSLKVRNYLTTYILLKNYDKSSLDIIQGICATSEVYSLFPKTIRSKEYSLRIYHHKAKRVKSDLPCAIKEEDYDGYVGCVAVPSSFILVRRNGRTFISGNSIQAKKLDMNRGDVKSLNYGLLYGAQIPKIMKMLSCSKDKATHLFNDFWASAPALLELKTELEREWEISGKNHIVGIDGRKLMIRSKHSILNALFQSAGAIFAKYVTILLLEKIQKAGYITSPFDGKIDVCSLIEYHDEVQLYVDPDLIDIVTGKTKEEIESFIKSQNKKGRFSEIGEMNGKYYVALPNIISNSMDSAIREAESILKLNVKMDYAYSIGFNWAQCH